MDRNSIEPVDVIVSETLGFMGIGEGIVNYVSDARRKWLKPDGKIISLIKPHYESPRYYLRKGKLPDDKMDEVLQMVGESIEKCGGKILKMLESPILGEKGKNREFLALIIRQGEA